MRAKLSGDIAVLLRLGPSYKRGNAPATELTCVAEATSKPSCRRPFLFDLDDAPGRLNTAIYHGIQAALTAGVVTERERDQSHESMPSLIPFGPESRPVTQARQKESCIETSGCPVQCPLLHWAATAGPPPFWTEQPATPRCRATTRPTPPRRCAQITSQPRWPAKRFFLNSPVEITETLASSRLERCR